MTTNKPKVFEVYRTKEGTLENVVLLTDYEAIQAECERLVEALERISNMDSRSYHSLESAKIVARSALAAYRKGGV